MQDRDPTLQHYAKSLRRTLTPPEARLWAALKGRGVAGAKFSRQIVVGRYIADFMCKAHRLIVEVDGAQHDLTHAADQERERWLRSQGYRVLRFRNADVRDNLDGVMAVIAAAVAERRP